MFGSLNDFTFTVTPPIFLVLITLRSPLLSNKPSLSKFEINEDIWSLKAVSSEAKTLFIPQNYNYCKYNFDLFK
jgi:hypothetical protein